MTPLQQRMGFKPDVAAPVARRPAPGFPLWAIPYYHPGLTTVGRCGSCGCMAKGQRRNRLMGMDKPCHLCGGALEIFKRCSDCKTWKPYEANFGYMGFKYRPRRQSYCRRCRNARRTATSIRLYKDPAYAAKKKAYKLEHYRRDPERWRKAARDAYHANPLPVGMKSGKKSKTVKEAKA